MLARKMIPFLMTMVLLLNACSVNQATSPTPESPATETQVAGTHGFALGTTDMASKLTELGGKPCEENPDFTCVTISVPLDHFDATNAETLKVVFAVSPAKGERYGMFIQAFPRPFPAGPGSKGISIATLDRFSDEILDHYDIVYFDQRGVGLSGALECPKAYKANFMGYLTASDQDGVEGYDTPAEQKQLAENTQAYVNACVAEIGIDPSKLKFYGTNQVAEDIDSFREAIGDEKMILNGVSYGTAVAETYAAAHANRLAGLILDGAIDLTLTGEERVLSQEKAFDKVLVATLKSCNADEVCAAEFNGDALAAYDNLAKQVSEKPILYTFPLPSGTSEERKFTLNQLEFTANKQTFSLIGRMLFLRALAAAYHNDIVPMARLLYSNGTIDPVTFEYSGDPTFSDTMSLGVDCADNSYFSGTQDERIAKSIEASQAFNGTVPRLDGSVNQGFPCAFWPSAPTGIIKAEPLKAEGVPTFVLNATLDPFTPFEEGKAVFENLADGYHIYVEGGRHSIYGAGYDCPDKYIADFLVNGKLPDKREILCEDWEDEVTRPYEPLPPTDASAFADAMEAFQSFDTQTQLQPEYIYGSFEKDVTVTCPFGGTFTFEPSDVGETYTFDKCAYSRGFEVTGTGNYDFDSGVGVIEATVSGLKDGTLTYTCNYNEETCTLTGEYGGETINIKK